MGGLHADRALTRYCGTLNGVRFGRAATVVLLAAMPLVSHDTSKVMAQEASWAVLHVAQRHPLASDRNGGTADAPIRSIGEAVRRALQNRRGEKSTRVQIQPGIYRESIELNGDDTDSAARIVLRRRGRRRNDRFRSRRVDRLAA